MAPNPIILRYHFGNFVHLKGYCCSDPAAVKRDVTLVCRVYTSNPSATNCVSY